LHDECFVVRVLIRAIADHRRSFPLRVCET
jgi:hypothetical protein